MAYVDKTSQGPSAGASGCLPEAPARGWHSFSRERVSTTPFRRCAKYDVPAEYAGYLRVGYRVEGINLHFHGWSNVRLHATDGVVVHVMRRPPQVFPKDVEYLFAVAEPE